MSNEQRDGTVTYDGVGYVPLSLIREAMGNLPVRTFEDRIIRSGVTTYADPRDQRRRMVRAEDVVRLTAPVPIAPRSTRLRHEVS